MKAKTFKDIFSILLCNFNLHIKLLSINLLLKFPNITRSVRIKILLRPLIVIANNKVKKLYFCISDCQSMLCKSLHIFSSWNKVIFACR